MHLSIKVACVGDSITAGAHSSGGNHTYPAQLQMLLGDGYVVTNLGACGSTMTKHGDSPYWQRVCCGKKTPLLHPKII